MYFAGIKLDFPQVSVIFSISGKELGIKKILFPVDKIFPSLVGMKNWLRNMSQLKKKLHSRQQLTAV